MVVFGAGASFDSLPKTSWPQGMSDAERESCPPLTKELFGPRRAFVEFVLNTLDTASIVARLRNVATVDGDIEETIQALVAEEKNDPAIARQLMALRYYLQNVFRTCSGQWLRLSGGATNYVDLLELIRRHRGKRDVLLVTFNYDLLLDDACSRALHFQLASMPDYVQGHPGWQLIKPHGSANWSRLVERSPAPDTDAIISMAAELEREGPIVFRNTGSRQTKMEFPAIAVPTTSKSLFECPQEHVAALKEALPTVERVITIGWRAGEAEFLELCGYHLPLRSVRALVVDAGAESAALPASRLEANFPEGSVVTPSPAPGFSLLLQRHVDELVAFLRE